MSKIPIPSDLKAGDHVEMDGMPGVGRVIEIDSRRKRARVAIGSQEWVLKLALLRQTASPAEEHPREPRMPTVSGAAPVQYEIDLHGMRAEDAIIATEALLDQAIVNHLAIVRIIHGHGKGVLRTEIRKLLSRHRSVAAYRFGHPYEGGMACTIAELKQS